MSERPLPHQPPEDRQATWDAETLAAALAAAVAPTQDLALGQGFRLSLFEQPTHIDCFPTGRAAQIVASDARMLIVVADQEPPLIAAHGIIFERPGRSLAIDTSGDIRLDVHPEPTQQIGNAVERAETPAAASDQPDVQDRPETPVSANDVTSQTPLTPAPDDRETSTTPESERIRLVGRLGANPSFRTTRNGVLIGTFPLAVRVDDERTNWHTVRAFKERAEKLHGSGLTKGQAAEVIGYRHQRERTTRDGGTKLVEEIYAVVIKPR